MELVVRLLPEAALSGLYASAFEGRLHGLAMQPAANFVVQSMVGSPVSLIVFLFVINEMSLSFGAVCSLNKA
eukprot:scaffold435296_cov32-Prasinocladus_malaysianus.AAC.1